MAVTESSSDSQERELDQTPTWAVASVCAVFIIMSIVLEKFLHKVGTWLTAQKKRALYEALEKIKAELMILGFVSLLLAFGQGYIARICVPVKLVDAMLPCGKTEGTTGRRRLLWYKRRYLAASSPAPSCKEGHSPFISINGLHQLHILIFFLAVLHVIYSATTMMLGTMKIRGWKHWEQETSTHNYEFSNDPSRVRLTHETSFVKRHTSFWTRIPVFFYVGCFSRQFYRSVSKADYWTLRNGFITVHLPPGCKFNFQKYIERSLEDDFKVVVGVSPVLWGTFVFFLLFNVKGWQALFWASFLPLLIILIVGTKLQTILTRMALEISEQHVVVQGIPLVEGSDEYFWFRQPQLILYLIHFALFQNAFQLTYFLWIWYDFGFKSCFHHNFKFAIAKICLGVGVLCLCSYVTLPLYALVTQMGSGMKKLIFDEQTSKALKNWHEDVRKKQQLGKGGNKSPTTTLGGSTTPSSSTVRPSTQKLRRYKTTDHSAQSHTYGDIDASDSEAEILPPPPAAPPSTATLIVKVDRGGQQVDANESNHLGGAKNEEEFLPVKPDQLKDSTVIMEPIIPICKF